MKESPARVAERMRRELRAVHDTLAGLAVKLEAMELQAGRAAALRAEEPYAGERVERLEHVLDIDRVAAHIRDAVTRTELVDDPVPHALVSDVLPADTYRAAADAIPPPIFFELRSGRHELAIPPTLAPAHVIVVWTFVADAIKEVLAPALVKLFREPLDRHIGSLSPSAAGLRDSDIAFTASRGRLVRRCPGDARRSSDRASSDWLTVVLDLGGTHSNSALVVFDPTAAHAPFLRRGATSLEAERYECEFCIGPHKTTRHW